MANVFIEKAALDNCKNPDSFGEICVKCNQCQRFKYQIVYAYKNDEYEGFHIAKAENKEQKEAIENRIIDDETAILIKCPGCNGDLEKNSQGISCTVCGKILCEDCKSCQKCI